MAHAHTNTLLNRLISTNKDKQPALHDDACISIVENPLAIISLLSNKEIKDVDVKLESPLTKGDGRYMTTVGFVDVMIRWEEKRAARKPQPDDSFFTTYADALATYTKFPYCWGYESVLIEVKTSIGSVGDLLRQMNLYRQHAEVCSYIVWSLNPDDARYADVLESQGYILLVGPIGSVTLSDPPVTS